MTGWDSARISACSVVVLALLAGPGHSQTPTPRNPAVVHAFRKDHPCPATGKTDGPCPGWVVDHLYPLCAGGLDAVANMAWQEEHASYIKDRLERDFCACKKAYPTKAVPQ